MSSSSSWLSCLFPCVRTKSSSDDGAAARSAAASSTAELDFSHCSLDDVPGDIFAYERTLERLFLGCNNIRDLPRQLFQCQELRELDLSDNDVHHLPPAIASLHQLTRLDLCKNVLTEIPDTIKQLKQLNALDASVNPLQKVPEGCTQLLNVTELYLNDTFLEFLPANFGRLVKLRILELRENGLAALPKSLARLTSLQRLDIGQNCFSDLPEVVGSLTELTELWTDGNRINEVSAVLGSLTKLNHLELSFNQIERVSEALANCKSLEYLSLSTNDLQELPLGVGELPNLITLKVDDNQLESLPDSLGGLASLEELIVSQNYLVALPASIGLCRRLHTLNVDENDIEYLPSELGSCSSLRVLNAHANRLTTLPAELDHIAGLSVINLTGNLIRHLPVSFTKLRHITALWLAENQNKPLIQLNQDTDPDTGCKVLTNFLLPQQPQEVLEEDKKSDSGSFHASVWEEERSRNCQVKWAGDSEEDEDSRRHDERGSARLRREPTPFPKEMREMAKRVQNMRAGRSHQQRRGKGVTDFQIKEAKVSKPQASPVLSERHLMSVYEDERTIREQMELRQFEELERSLNIAADPTEEQKDVQPPLPKRSPPQDKSSRDSGVITPSDSSGVTSPDSDTTAALVQQTRKPSDPLPSAPPQEDKKPPRPPPYHIAAASSKRASDFLPKSEERTYENHGIGGSDTSHCPSESSSLQTVVPSFRDEPGDVVDDTHARQLRKVSEQLLSNPRTRQSVTGIPVLMSSKSSRPNSLASPRGTTIVSKSPPFVSHSGNGLLSTIEKAAHSDEEGVAGTGACASGDHGDDEDDENRLQQHNYENVSANNSASRIPKFSLQSNPRPPVAQSGIVVSTSNFVVQRGHQGDALARHRRPSESRLPVLATSSSSYVRQQRQS